MRKLASFAALLILLMLTVGLSVGQNDELLRNSGFEQPYLDGPEGTVAEGWTSWFVGPESERPDYLVAPTDRAVSGDAQAYSSFLAVHRAGLYQSVTGLAPGAPLTFTANVWVWSTQDDLDPAVSVNPGVVLIDVGIDTTGSVDPEGASIIWSAPVEAYDAFTPVSVTAAPSGEFATVFIRTTVSEARLLTEVYVDDASLVAEPMEVATEAPTVEVEATEDVAPTDAPVEPTDEPAPTEEEAATEDAAPTEEVAQAEPTESPFLSTVEYVVQSGDSYDQIARTYGSTVAAIKEANGVGPDDNIIYPGDVLIVPVRVPAIDPSDTADATETAPEVTVTFVPIEEPTAEPTIEPTAEEATPAATEEIVPDVTAVLELQTTYTVQRGDILMDIANRFDVNVIELGRLNNILNYNLIYPGQVLTLPGRDEAGEATPEPTATPAPVRHFVQFGDSIYRIAARYGVTSQAIIEANGIDNPNRIYYGQILIIPR